MKAPTRLAEWLSTLRRRHTELGGVSWTGVVLLCGGLGFLALRGEAVAELLPAIPLLGAGLLIPLVRPNARQRTELCIPRHVDPDRRAMLQSSWQLAAHFYRTSHWVARAYLFALGMLVSACVAASASMAVTYILAPESLMAAFGGDFNAFRCTGVIADPQLREHCEAAQNAVRDRALLSVVFLATTGTVFSLSTGSIALRISRGDLTPRFVALQFRALLYVVLTALVTGSLLIYTGVVDAYPKAFLAGVIAGLLGEQLLATAFDSIALIFGVSLGGDQLDEFELVQGLDDDERLRIKEHGVQSIQSLAYASTAALFMSTRYSYSTLCDWQDQALLLLHAGGRRARVLQRNGLRRASEARAWLAGVENQRVSTVMDDFVRRSLELEAGIEELQRMPLEPPLLSALQQLANTWRSIRLDALAQAEQAGTASSPQQRARWLAIAPSKLAAHRAQSPKPADLRLSALLDKMDVQLRTTETDLLQRERESLLKSLTALGFKAANEAALALDAVIADKQTELMAIVRDCFPKGLPEASDGNAAEPTTPPPESPPSAVAPATAAPSPTAPSTPPAPPAARFAIPASVATNGSPI